MDYSHTMSPYPYNIELKMGKAGSESTNDCTIEYAQLTFAKVKYM